MARDKRPMVILVILVIVVSYVGYTQLLPANIGGLYDTTVDWTEVCTVDTIKQNNLLEIINGASITFSGQSWMNSWFVVIVTFTETAYSNDFYWEIPDTDFRAELVVDGIVMETDNSAAQKFGYGWQFDFNNLGAISQGTHSAQIRLRGTYSAEQYGPYSTSLSGSLVSFSVTNTDVAKPDPIQITNKQIDITMEPYDTQTLTWDYKYAGPMTISVLDDGKSLYSTDVPSSTIFTTFSYNYYAVVSGDHLISVEFLPVDGLDNDKVTDTANIHINVGGEAPTFPPSVDRVDIKVTQDLVDSNPTNVFITGWYSDVARKGTYTTQLDGVLDVVITVEPAGAFIAMKVMIENNEYPLYRETGWTADVFSTKNPNGADGINTDLLDAGLHTIEFWGFDSDNAEWYQVGSFTLPIRTDGSGLEPIMLAGIGVAAVGVFAIIFFRKRKR